MSTGSPGIRVGTAIGTFIKRGNNQSLPPEETPIHIRDFWGEADAKRQALLDSLAMDEWDADTRERAAEEPAGPRPYEQFTASEHQRWKLVPYAASGGYEDWFSLNELFPVSFQGINPNRGLAGSVIAMHREDLEDRMRDYFSETLSFEDLEERHPAVCELRARYHPAATRSILRQQKGYDEDKITPYLLFPLDRRYLYYETGHKLLNESRPDLKANLRSENSLLLAVPQPRRQSESIPLFATTAFDLHVHDRGSVGLPARIYNEPDQSELFDDPEEGPRANLNPDVWARISDAWNLEGGLSDDSALQLTDHLIRVCLALGHAPQYQEDHSETLAQDWARMPVPSNRELFLDVADVGQQVATLLDVSQDARSLLEEELGSETVAQLATLERVDGGPISEDDLAVEISYYGSATGRWEERTWREEETQIEALGETTGDLYLNDQVRLSNVPRNVWELELGGYPVISKWLGYRHVRYRDGEPLSLPEKDTLRNLVHRLAAIVLLHPRLDDLYDRAAADAWTLPE